MRHASGPMMGEDIKKTRTQGPCCGSERMQNRSGSNQYQTMNNPSVLTSKAW